jgi:hypothetical protein
VGLDEPNRGVEFDASRDPIQLYATDESVIERFRQRAGARLPSVDCNTSNATRAVRYAASSRKLWPMVSSLAAVAACRRRTTDLHELARRPRCSGLHHGHRVESCLPWLSTAGVHGLRPQLQAGRGSRPSQAQRMFNKKALTLLYVHAAVCAAFVK